MTKDLMGNICLNAKNLGFLQIKSLARFCVTTYVVSECCWCHWQFCPSAPKWSSTFTWLSSSTARPLGTIRLPVVMLGCERRNQSLRLTAFSSLNSRSPLHAVSSSTNSGTNYRKVGQRSAKLCASLCLCMYAWYTKSRVRIRRNRSMW